MKTRELELYTPHPGQLQIHDSRKRYNIGVWGRQSGKSTYGINKITRATWENRGHVYWFISPTFAQAKVQYRRTMQMLWPVWRDIGRKKNQSELRIKLRSGSAMFFKSADRPDNLRTETLNGVILDELRELDPDLYPLVIRPMLGTTGGWADFLTTPNGFDDTFDFYERAKQDKRFGTFHAPSTINPKFTQEELEEARKSMTQAQFEQEILAEFRDLTAGKVYANYSDANMTSINPITRKDSISKHLPILVAPDFNLSPMAWMLGQTHVGKTYWHDEIWIERSNTQEAAQVLVEKVRYHDKGVIIAGDATSKAGQRAAASQSDYDILFNALKDADISWQDETPDSNPSVKDRVNTMNVRFKNAKGEATQWHHPRCKMFRKDCQRVLWKDGANWILDPGKKRLLTHSSDGAGYGLCATNPLPSHWEVGRLRVISPR